MRTNIKQKHLIIFAIVLVAILAAFFAYFYTSNQNQTPPSANYSNFRKLYPTIKEIKKLWYKPDLSKFLKNVPDQCKEFVPDLSLVDSIYYRCNLNVQRCLQKINWGIDPNHAQIGITNFKYEGAKTFSRPANIRLNIKLQKHEFNIELNKSCHEVYLPESVYAYGPLVKKKKDFLWSSQGRSIFVDKFLVTNEEVLEWKKSSGAKISNYVPKNAQDKIRWMLSPATNLLPKEMKQFCKFHGKALLTASVYDAAAFYWNKSKSLDDFIIPRGDTYWSAKRFLTATKDLDLETKCQKIYSSECINGPYKIFLANHVSQVGLANTLGGPLEYLVNNIEPLKNLRLSSYYFPLESRVHRVGVRAEWDGDGHQYKNFKWGIHEPDASKSKFNVAFRCMRELSE